VIIPYGGARSGVQGSTSGAKRSFLLGKGLTDEEIDAAFEKAKSVLPLASPSATATAPAQHAQPTGHSAPSQMVTASPQSTAVQPSLTGDFQASWMRISAAVVLVGFATVGAGTVAMPYLQKGWRWFMGTGTSDSESSEAKRLSEMLDKHTQQQEEVLKQVQGVASAVKTLQVTILHRRFQTDSF
jgi:hypothetical protein